jgi:hypothetical protein
MLEDLMIEEREVQADGHGRNYWLINHGWRSLADLRLRPHHMHACARGSFFLTRKALEQSQ